MSSIDKYVIQEAQSIDPRVTVVNLFGRIKGYIGGVKVFDIADRHGYIDSYESAEIANGIREYHINQARIEEEERRRRIEEERRRAEEHRQESLRRLRGNVERKKNSLESNISAVTTTYNNKKNEIEEVRNGLTEIKRIFPKGSIGKLELIYQELSNKVQTTFDAVLSNLNEKKNQVSLIEKKINGNMSIEEIDRLLNELQRLDTSSENARLSINTKVLLEEIKTAKDNAQKISEILRKITVIKDETIIKQIELEISGIDLCDSEVINRTMNQINNRIESYRLSLDAKISKELINELNTIEGIAKAIKTLNEYSAVDTYTFTKLDKEIIEKATSLAKQLVEIYDSEFNVMNDDELEQNLKELYDIASQPKNTTEEQNVLKRVEMKIKHSNDLIKEYKEQYQIYKELYDNIQSVEIVDPQDDEVYTKAFDYKNYIKQIQEMQAVYVNRLRKKEAMVVSSVAFDVIEAMAKTGYTVFKKEATSSYQEIFFMNEKYPGVLTKILVDWTGSFRRSVVAVSINGKVTKTEKIIEMSVEMENDVEQFLNEFGEMTGNNFTLDENMISYDSPNAMEFIEEEGYVEIEGEGISIYNEGVNKKKKYDYSQLLGVKKPNQKRHDSSREKQRIATSAPSYRYMK